MRLSHEGLEQLKRFEELRIQAYDDLNPHRELHPGDPVEGTVTIGWGHTRTAFPGQRITKAEAEELLCDDLEPTENAVRRLTEGVSLRQHEFDALVSFAFNVGVGALDQSTLLSKLLSGDRAGAADEFERWVFSKGQRLSGLEKRRQAERALFLGHG